MNTGLLGGVVFVLVFAGMILVHELGHFIAAKSVGVRVDAFSIGFGPHIGRKWGDTDYRLSLLPLGGYVKLAGEQHDVNMDRIITERRIIAPALLK